MLFYIDKKEILKTWNRMSLHYMTFAAPPSHGFTNGLYRCTKQNTYLIFTSLQQKFLNPTENIGLSSSKSVWLVVVACSSRGHGCAGYGNSFFYPLCRHMKNKYSSSFDNPQSKRRYNKHATLCMHARTHARTR
jgi:hypothetical protein